MTSERAKALHDKVNSLLTMCGLDTPLDGLLLQANALCILGFESQDHRQATTEDGEEELRQVEEKKTLNHVGRFQLRL
jgi:hypothetical protein